MTAELHRRPPDPADPYATALAQQLIQIGQFPQPVFQRQTFFQARPAPSGACQLACDTSHATVGPTDLTGGLGSPLDRRSVAGLRLMTLRDGSRTNLPGGRHAP